MIRTLLTTSAVALLLATPAFAQDNAMQPVAPAAGTVAPGAMNNDLMTRGYMATTNDRLASRLMGQPIYTSAADDAEQIGDINDLVLNQDGKIGAVVVGVGGFLGLGEKNVAIDYSQLQWTIAADNTQRIVLPATKDSLTAAVDFTWPDDTQNGAMDTAATLPADNAMTPADPALGTDTAAMQPAPADGTLMANPPADAMETAATQPPVANPGATDYSTMAPIDRNTLTAENVIGTRVVGPQNEDIAEVGDIVLTPDGQIDALLVDFGGFLGIGEKRVAIGMDNLRFVQDASGIQYVFVNVTREQLDAAQSYDEATYDANPQAQRLVVAN